MGVWGVSVFNSTLTRVFDGERTTTRTAKVYLNICFHRLAWWLLPVSLSLSLLLLVPLLNVTRLPAFVTDTHIASRVRLRPELLN